uniref:hypothetical protein n=1 Tax=Crenothrix polyspora TaxID=360316 RepID=UPI001178209E|nr:hypothetical protein [Crenothrix polyspora]
MPKEERTSPRSIDPDTVCRPETQKISKKHSKLTNKLRKQMPLSSSKYSGFTAISPELGVKQMKNDIITV